MRPVVRGAAPVGNAGAPIAFKSHREARDYLIKRIGDYCSYCENALPSDVDVEHVQPKSHHPTLKLDWDNFLLACTYCNRTKWDTDVNLSDYLWPDRDNTFRGLIYELDQPPGPQKDLAPNIAAIVQRTIELTGLDRVPGHPKYSDRDRRFVKRKEAWGVALISLKEFRAGKASANSILLTALSRGFFSIWMTVFQGENDMRRLFIKGFVGTSDECFDNDTKPIARPGGAF